MPGQVRAGRARGSARIGRLPQSSDIALSRLGLSMPETFPGAPTHQPLDLGMALRPSRLVAPHGTEVGRPARAAATAGLSMASTNTARVPTVQLCGCQ